MSPVQIKHHPVNTIISKSNLPVTDYAVNPYTGCTHACRYCYATFMKRFTGHQEPWGTFLDVKEWPVLTNTAKYAGKEIFIGSVTDPYVPEEAIFKRTRTLLEQLKDSSARISLSTKSDLVLRDLDLLQQIPGIRIAWSINTLDETFKNDMDQAVSIERRLNAMQQCYQRGIRTVCFISPIFPGITDVPAIIERVRQQCHYIWLENLNLRSGFKEDILNYISSHYPQLIPLYHSIYSEGDLSYWQQLDQSLQAYAATCGLDYVINDDTMTRPLNAPPVLVNFFYHEQIRKHAIPPAAADAAAVPAAAPASASTCSRARNARRRTQTHPQQSLLLPEED